jgi:hypothetical protein
VIDGGRGGVGTVWGNINTGNNRFTRQTVTPDNSPIPPDAERAYHDSLAELNQLHQLAHTDPQASKEVQDLIREMQKLDPSRFPGNPAMVEELHTQVLGEVDKLELELRHDVDDQSAGQVRTSKSSTVPKGYQDAVAEYYRRLSKGQ